jgi:hypothetical protein
VADEVEVVEDARVQRYVLRYIGKKSAREMASELGVTPEEILRAKRELIEFVDPLTLQLQRLQLLTKLQELADMAYEKAAQISDERNFSGAINSSVGAIKTLLIEYNRASAKDDVAVSSLNQLRVRELFSLMVEVIEAGVREISDEHGLDEQELYGVFNRNLSEAAAKRES